MKEAVKKILNKVGFTLTRNSITPHPQHTKPVTAENFFDLYFSMINPQDFFFV